MIGEQELLKSKAVYDTQLSGTYNYLEDRLARSSSILGERQNLISQDMNISKRLPTGTILSAGASHQRQYGDSAFTTLNPYHETDATVSVTQPLLKDFFGMQERNSIKVADLSAQNIGYTSADKIEQEIAEAKKAYWRLVMAQQENGISEQILSSAQRLLDVTKRNFDIGAVEKAEYYAVEANVLERQRDLVLVKTKLSSIQNDLIYRLNLSKGISIIPKDEPVFTKHVFDFNEILSSALGNRRDYLAAKNEAKARNLTLSMKNNSLWPQLDLIGTFKRNGIDGKFAKSVHEISGKDDPEYIIGFEFSFPLENTRAKGEFKQAKLDKVRSLVTLKKLECAIFIQVKDAIDYCNATQQAADYQFKAMQFQENKYRAEEERFKSGRSDIDKLIRYQQDYLSSQVSYLNAIYAYNEALVNLDVITAGLLRKVEG